MPLIGEQLVEEWLNRLGFFTIRGLRDGVDEIDLLGIRSANNGIEGWHVEVQISFRPVAYVTKLTKEQARSLGKGRTSAWTRPPDVLSESVDFWVENKFRAKDKANARSRAWPGVDWRFVLVHGVVKHEDELAEIQKHGIVTIPLHQALTESFSGEHRIHLGAAGADFADVISYYKSQKSGANIASPRLGG